MKIESGILRNVYLEVHVTGHMTVSISPGDPLFCGSHSCSSYSSSSKCSRSQFCIQCLLFN